MGVCINPFPLCHDGKEFSVNCGKCPPCMARRISQWSVRLVNEGKRHMSAAFVTLTYAPEHCPVTEKKFMTLKKKDLQNFFKRLRKRHERYNISNIKYFAAGEYGTHTKRPHYHCIIFGAISDVIPLAWSLDREPIGFVHIGSVSEASIGYTLKYINKKAWRKFHYNDDRLPEFQLFSKGLGSNYLTDSIRRWHLSDISKRYYVPLMDGRKVSMPRYYRDKIYNDEEKLILNAAMMELAIEREYALYEQGITLDMHYSAIMQNHLSKIKNKVDKL